LLEINQDNLYIKYSQEIVAPYYNVTMKSSEGPMKDVREYPLETLKINFVAV